MQCLGESSSRTRVLVIHQNFPGQFRRLVHHWSRDPQRQVIGIGREIAPGMPDIRWLRYRPHRPPAPTQHRYLVQMENAVLHGQAVVRELLALKRGGFIPDVVLAHPGWGETLYVKDAFPDARLIHFCEWFYGANGADVGFDPEFPITFDDRARVRTWNALHLLNLENCDAGITPTRWQHSRHPEAYRDKIRILHEGVVDTGSLGPDPTASLALADGRVLRAGDPVITYVARNLEPYRGFHIFMRALEIVQRQHKHCQALIVGADGISYGSRPKDAASWREKMLSSVQLDASRTHFLGHVSYSTYRRVLQVSAVHVYLTYPFVLSWSVLEAMASGCLVIGSRTAPVEEVIRDGNNGLLTEFFDTAALAERILEALDTPDRFATMRANARQTVRERYDIKAGLDGYTKLVFGQSGTAVTPTVRAVA